MHAVRLTPYYLAQPLFSSALVVDELTCGLAVAQDTTLDKLDIWSRSVAAEPNRRSFALGLRHGNDDLLGGALDPRELDQASISQLT